MSQYSEMMGSFIRTGDYPMEANYIFENEEALKKFFEDELNKTLLHKGLLKLVEKDKNNKLALYWVVPKGEGEEATLEFKELLTADSIDELEKNLKELQEKLNQEITDRKAEDTKIWGTETPDDLPDDFDSIKDLADLLQALITFVYILKAELKAVVGTEDDDIRKYLESLNYKNLTDVSKALHHFLDEIDDTDESINTLPELKQFLEGFSYKHNLKEVFKDFWNYIEGDPTPNEPFRTLRGIQDFVMKLKEAAKNHDDNLQKELDKTQVGVGLDASGAFSPDSETHYLLEATSVMNALKILDALLHQYLKEFIIQAVNEDVVPLKVTKTDNGYDISASLTLAPDPDNLLLKKNDGLYYHATLDYNAGNFAFRVNDKIISTFNINLDQVLKDGHYDSTSEEIVLTFNTLDGEDLIIRIPVHGLIEEWEIKNDGPTDVVELKKELVVNGTDKLSADVRLAVDNHNILKKKDNTLIVDGTSDSITYNDKKLTEVLKELETKDSSLDSELKKETEERKAQDAELEKKIAKNTEDIEDANQAIEDLKTADTQHETELKSLELKIDQETTRATLKESEISDKVTKAEASIESVKELITEKGNDITDLLEELKKKAPINDPKFTGSPLTTLPEFNDSSDRIPTTSWVWEKLLKFPFIDPESYWLKLKDEEDASEVIEVDDEGKTPQNREEESE